MNYTFQIEDKTKERHEKIIQCLYALGYKNSDTCVISAVEYTKKYGFQYPWTIIDIDRKVFSGNTREYKEHTTITFDEFLSLKKDVNIEIKLNDEYTAIVSKDNVKVGCQTFPLSVITKLYNAVEKMKHDHDVQLEKDEL